MGGGGGKINAFRLPLFFFWNRPYYSLTIFLCGLCMFLTFHVSPWFFRIVTVEVNRKVKSILKRTLRTVRGDTTPSTGADSRLLVDSPNLPPITPLNKRTVKLSQLPLYIDIYSPFPVILYVTVQYSEILYFKFNVCFQIYTRKMFLDSKLTCISFKICTF